MSLKIASYHDHFKIETERQQLESKKRDLLKKRQAQQELMTDTDSALTVFKVFADKIKKQSQIKPIEIQNLQEIDFKSKVIENKGNLDEIILVISSFLPIFKL
jgi:hypothetical protein